MHVIDDVIVVRDFEKYVVVDVGKRGLKYGIYERLGTKQDVFASRLLEALVGKACFHSWQIDVIHISTKIGEDAKRECLGIAEGLSIGKPDGVSERSRKK